MASIRCRGQSVVREDENRVQTMWVRTGWESCRCGRTLIFLPNFIIEDERRD